MRHLKTLTTLVLILLANTVASAYDIYNNFVYYEIISSQKQTVRVTRPSTGYDKVMSGGGYDIKIPSKFIHNNVTFRVVEIGDYAFTDCKNMYSVTIPASVEVIGNRAFAGCTRLSKIEIPNSVKTIGWESFQGCTKISNLEIPNSVCEILNGAFANCTGIKTMNIGKSVEKIGSGIFEGCTALESIVVDSENSNFDSREECNAIIETSTNKLITSCKNTFIPYSVISIGDNAFSGLKDLTSIVIPNSVKYIGSNAFEDCTELSFIEIPNSVVQIEQYAFSNCDKLRSIEIPNSTIGEHAFQACDNLEEVIIGDSVTTIGDYAFTICENLKLLILGKSLKRVGEGAFFRCGDLRMIYSHSPNPPTITVKEHHCFDSNVYQHAILYVPTGSKDEYETANTWLNFWNVTEREFGTYYKVTYLVDGEVFAVDSIACGTKIVLRDEPAKEGYTFKGWSNIPETMPAYNIVINGTFSVNYYTVTYVVDGEEYKVDTLAYGTEIVLVDAPEKNNYTFSGWSDAPKTMPACNITITGLFTEKKYSVTYIVNDEVYANDSIKFGEIIEPITEPTKEGYTFSGWSEIPEIMPANDITIIGTFIINKYLVTFKVDGEVIAADSLEFGKEIIIPDVPMKEGYTFNGWGEPIDITSLIVNNNFDPSKGDKNQGIIEGWVTGSMNSYKQNTVSYNRSAINLHQDIAGLNPGTYEVTVHSYYRAGDYNNEWELYQQSPINTHLTSLYAETTDNRFETKIMNLLEDASEESYGVQCYTLPNGKFAPDGTSSAIKFFNEGHYLNKLRFVVGKDGKARIGLEKTEILNSDYQLVGEWRLYSCEGMVAETVPANDVTYESGYSINSYLLTYVVDGDTIETDSVTYGTAISLLAEPTKEGHTFSGWSEEPETMPANDITISGAFTVNRYLVTFKIGDEVIASDSLEYGATIIAPEAPEREGYTFDGWGEIAETVPASDVAFEGSYSVNTYKVYYYVGEELVHTEEVVYGEAIPEYIYEPKEDCTFLGWIGDTYETMPAHDVTYTANIESGIEELTKYNGQLTIYDFTGRKVTDTEKLKSGIYIINRRKLVIH